MQLKGETGKAIIKLGDFGIHVSVIQRSSRKKTNKDTEALNKTINQLDLINIRNVLHTIIHNTCSFQVHREHQ